ncbi:MAG TPA: SDR family oxidoreductase [Polyangiaceae bacterium]|jgi:NAD(P)-dependent dehydrogenase (short-subunit alcohol dehydrogenase family)|nr:SDR family oxidoreductase [Polyangiaceae bacterium]
MSVLAMLKGKGPSGYGYGSTAEVVTQGLALKGKNFLVTGSTSGLGLETVRVLAQRGGRVFATGRTKEKAEAAAHRVPGVIVPLECELSDPKSVRGCVAALKQEGVALDAIIANAGIMALPTLQQAFGYELQFFTNHIGHFLLVTGLLDQLTEKGRVVMLSSGAHVRAPKVGIEFDNLSGERKYSPWTAYGQSKLANLLFAKELAKHLKGTQKTANALHPGVIKTNLGRSMASFARVALALAEPLFLKSEAEGAATQCYVATRPELDGVSGEYFADCNIAKSSAVSYDAALATRLWEESERIAQKL